MSRLPSSALTPWVFATFALASLALAACDEGPGTPDAPDTAELADTNGDSEPEVDALAPDADADSEFVPDESSPDTDTDVPADADGPDLPTDADTDAEPDLAPDAPLDLPPDEELSPDAELEADAEPDALDATDPDLADAEIVDPLCDGVEVWTSIYGGSPACFDYTVDEHFDANFCEFWVDGIGDGYEGHYGIPWQWVEAYLVVNPQQGSLRNVGMLTLYTDANGTSHSRTSLATAVGGDVWKTGFTYLATSPMDPAQNYSYTVTGMAFFIDVERPAGEIVRLWQSRGGANYAWDDCFASTTDVAIPYGHVAYANPESGVFDQKRGCE